MSCILFQIRTFRMAAIALTMLALLFAGTARPAQAQTYTPLYDFGAVDSSQTSPQGQLALGRDGNFYGTLMGNGHSEIYQITPDGAETLLWADDSPSETQCLTGLTLGSDGLLYGTCNYWGGNNYETGGSGIVFKYDPSQGQNGFAVLYSFPTCNSGHAASIFPNPLTLGTDGNFYGSTSGNTFCPDPKGTVFKVTPTGALTTLHVFLGASSNDGDTPSGPLTLGVDGNFYGTTQLGGNIGQNGGAVFKITPKGKITLLYSFVNTYEPLAGVTQGLDGKFYGTTSENGTYSNGTIFQLTTAGKIAYLHNFNYAVDDVAYPFNPLTLGTDGNLYGPSNCFSWGCGPESLYKITTKGVYADLYNGFTNPEGACPDWSPTGCGLSSPMALHPNGTFYGTTQQGGDNGQPIGRGVFYSFSAGLKPFVSLQFPLAEIGTTLGILGQGFTTATAVEFNGTPASFTVVSGTYLEATVPAGATKGYVTVTESSGSLKSNIEFVPKPETFAKPAITSFLPGSAIAGTAGFTLTVNGTGFVSSSVVDWAGSPRATTFVNANQITAAIEAADIAKAGTFKVTVANPASEGGTSAASNFVVDNPVPTLTSILPTSATHGSAAFTLTATGTNYVSSSVIEWNGKKLTTTYVSGTTLTTTVPAADIKTAGTASVTVVTPAPGGGNSAAQTFTID